MSERLVSEEEQKRIMLDMLVFMDQYCLEHGLTYFIDAGTLLGAVRHKGYIPWDDDIDINMPRADYDRFINETKKTNGRIGEIYQVEYPEKGLHVSLKLGDIRTVLIEYPDTKPTKSMVYLDIFPKDGIPNKGIGSRMICWVSEKLALANWFNKITIYKWEWDNSVFRRLIAGMGRSIIKNPDYAVYLQNQLIHRYAKIHPIEKCNYVTTLVNGEFKKIAPKSCFDKTIKMEFEGLFFNAPAGYDEYLRCLYPGDYMQLPPVEKRIKHNTVVYWK